MIRRASFSSFVAAAAPFCLTSSSANAIANNSDRSSIVSDAVPVLSAAVRSQTASFAPFASTRMQTTKPVKVVRSPSATEARLEGVIKSWHFVERTGEIEVADAGSSTTTTIYKIKNAQSFESIMPTSHRQSLVGIRVKFVPCSEPGTDDPSQIERSALGIEMLNLDDVPGARRALRAGYDKTSSLLSAKEISARLTVAGVDRVDEPSQNKPTWGITDMRAETLFAPGGFLSQGSGPSYSGPRGASGALSRIEQRDLGDGMVLQGNLIRVDAPPAFYLDGEVVAWSGITRTGLIRVPGQKDDAGRDVQYAVSNVDAFNSAMPSSTPLRGARVRFRPVHMHAVENADEVVATSGRCKLRLGKLTLSLAEKIDVVQLPAARVKELQDQKKSVAEEANSIGAGETPAERRSRQNAAARDRRAKQLFREWRADENDLDDTGCVDEADSEASQQQLQALFSTPQFGVITRWSGGQGVLESAVGRTFRIDSTKDFSTYFDVNSVSVRGAVVEFTVTKERPRYAADIKILSDMSAAAETGSVSQGTGDLRSSGNNSSSSGSKKSIPIASSTSVPLSSLPFDLSIDVTSFGGMSQSRGSLSSSSPSPSSAAEDGNDTAKSSGDQQHQPEQKSRNKKDVPSTIDFSQLPARYGILVSYSPAEFQGVVKCEQTGERFLLRDTRQDVQDFARIKSKLARGCKFEFRVVGSSGRLATYASLTLLANGEEAALVDQAELDASEGITGQGEGEGAGGFQRKDEAVAGPMAMSYWVARFEKVGCNMADFKSFQQQAFVPGEAPTDAQGKKIEVEDFRKKDAWFNDPEKNRKIPGTNARFSDLTAMNQTGLMELSNDFRDPGQLQKKMVELEAKVPVEMREQGMQKAKEFGPRYLKSIKEAQKRGESAANFNFSG